MFDAVVFNNMMCSQGSMFFFAKSFNQPIGDWDVSKGTNFVSGLNPVSLVEYFYKRLLTMTVILCDFI